MAHIPDTAGSQMCENCCVTLDTLPCGALDLAEKGRGEVSQFFPHISTFLITKRLGEDAQNLQHRTSTTVCGTWVSDSLMRSSTDGFWACGDLWASNASAVVRFPVLNG